MMKDSPANGSHFATDRWLTNGLRGGETDTPSRVYEVPSEAATSSRLLRNRLPVGSLLIPAQTFSTSAP